MSGAATAQWDGGVAGFPGAGAAPHSGKEKEWLDARLTKHNQPTERLHEIKEAGQHRTTEQGASFDCAAAHPPNPDSLHRLRTADEGRHGTGWEKAFYDKPSLGVDQSPQSSEALGEGEPPANPLVATGLTGHERKHQRLLQRRPTAPHFFASLEDREPPTHGSRSASLPSIPGTRARCCRGIPSSRACFDVPLAERLPAAIYNITMVPRGTTEEARQAKRPSA